MGIIPKTDAVMEYIVDDIGHLAYVEAVSSDESIKISSVGMFDEGMFSEIVMQRTEWIELRPVFIEINV
jgi:surface antigen